MRLRISLCITALGLSALATSARAQTTQPAPADRFATLRAGFQRWLDSTGAPSVAIAVAHNGKIVWEEAFGWANREKRIRATPHTMYSLASITKPFTATGLMILAERGQISLDSAANAYLGPGKLMARVGSARDATVRRVVSHTAGLPYHFQFFYDNGGYSPPPMDETFRRHANLLFAPGTQFEYSNLGYGILDHIIARRSGRSYADFMRREVFLPLGLSETAVLESAPTGAAYAERYDEKQRPIPFYTFDHSGASAIYSSAHDLARFGMFHLKNRVGGQRPILKDETIDLMQTAVSPALYGLGFRIDPEDYGFKRVFHGGSMPGVNTMLRIYPSENLALAVLTNAEINFGGLLADIAATFIPRFADSLSKRRAALAAQGASPAPAAPSFSPPASLVGEWIGAIHSWDGSLTLNLTVPPNGPVIAQVGNAPAAPVIRPRLQGGRFIAVIDGRIPTPDARWPHSIVLNVVLDDPNALTGQATAVTSGDVSHFGLSSFVLLRKR
jgi:CubicO group peptidase (beta-lactamase class C family)